MVFKRTLVLALAALTAVVGAWNANGHKQIADIAWSRLSRNAKIEIAKMLMVGDTVGRGAGIDAYMVPAPGPGGFSDEYLEKVVRPVFRNAATWADDIKGGNSSNFDARIDADNAASPGVRPPEGGSRRGEDNRCKTWHYYDDPINAPGDTAPHPARESNAVRALGIVRPDFEAQEKASLPDRKEQAYDLFWIEHLFGDLTQPLHCSESYMLNPKGDAGGNLFMTMAPNDYRPGSPENLHAYWDSGIDHAIAADPSLGRGAAFEKVTEAWLFKARSEHPILGADELDPMSWVKAGHELAIKFVYDDLKPMGVPDDAYNRNLDTLCEKQAVVAGLRLALYLNRVLTKGSTTGG